MDTQEAKDLKEKYSPKPNYWYSKNFVYEGQGKAFFQSPRGSIMGQVKITVNEIGEIDVEMKPEQVSSLKEIKGRPDIKMMKFLYKHRVEGTTVSFGLKESGKNICQKIVVQTENGTFISSGQILWDSNMLRINKGLQFQISGGTFTIKTRKRSKYWVAPLTNFLYDPFERDSSLDNHPLRIFPTPKVPVLPTEEMQKAIWYANSKNKLIIFKFAKQLGFIEFLPEYSDLKKNLKSENTKQAITAFMIGQVSQECGEKWFPHDYANFFAFLSGTEIGLPWIEFRNRRGELVCRKHLWAKDIASYSKGYDVINTLDHTIGELLTLANESPEFKETYYHVLINHLIRLSSYHRHIEDTMALIARSLDALCEKHKLSVQTLMNELSPSNRVKVDKIIADANEKIRFLEKKAKKKDLFTEEKTLHQIESKIANAKNTDRNFGLALADLFALYDIPDMQVMDSYYAKLQNSKYRSWGDLLTQYRGAAIHFGYFQVRDGIHNFEHIVQTEDHLHDILVRIALKIINYHGTYQPRVVYHTVTDWKVDWVTSDTPVSSFGYKE